MSSSSSDTSERDSSPEKRPSKRKQKSKKSKTKRKQTSVRSAVRQNQESSGSESSSSQEEAQTKKRSKVQQESSSSDDNSKSGSNSNSRSAERAPDRRRRDSSSSGSERSHQKRKSRDSPGKKKRESSPKQRQTSSDSETATHSRKDKRKSSRKQKGAQKAKKSTKDSSASEDSEREPSPPQRPRHDSSTDSDRPARVTQQSPKDEPDSPDQASVKVEVKDEHAPDVEVKQEEYSDDGQTVKREMVSDEERPQTSRVGDYVESDDDTVKILPTEEDLDWFAKKRLTARETAEADERGGIKRRKRYDTDDSSDKNSEAAKTPVYSPPRDKSRSVTPQMETLAEYEENRVNPEEEGSPDRVVEDLAEYKESRVSTRTDDPKSGDWFQKAEDDDASPEREPVHNRLGRRAGSEDRSVERDEDKSKDRKRDRRSRDRSRDRDRDRSKDRDRRRDRSRDKDRRMDRRDRSRDRSRDRRRSRDRSRDRDRSRERSRRGRQGRGRRDDRREGDRSRNRIRFKGERGDKEERGSKDKDNEKEGDEKKKEEMLPRKPKPEENPLALRSGGAYMPPHKLRALQASITDKTSEPYQRLTWEALKKSLNGLVNKVNTDNIKDIVIELFGENLVRGKGLFIRSIMTAQSQATPFTNVYAAAIAVINTKFPDIGDLLLDRLILQFKRSYLRNQKAICLSTVMFIGHLVNQQVVNEIICLEVLTLLLEKATPDSVEISIALLKEVGARLEELSPRAMHGIFDRLRSLLQEGDLDIRVKYMIEVMFAIRKDKFKDHPTFAPGLELVEEEDQITHLKQLDDKVKGLEILNVFKFDPSYEENTAKYQLIKNEILGSDDSEDEEGDDEEDSDEEEEEEGMEITDKTGTNMQALRRTIYLTIQSSLGYEECIHKLAKLQLKPGQEAVLVKLIIECCSQERSYKKFYGLLGERYCRLKREYIPLFAAEFQEQFETIHRLETNKLRNVGCCYAHMLYTDALPWTVFSIVRLTEADTTSSSRVFIKILLQEIASQMGEKKLRERMRDPTLQVCFEGLFPRDDPRNTRFSINYFTAIGLGYLTEELREWLKTAPPPAPTLTGLEDGSSSSSSSSSSDSSSSSSDSSSDSEDDVATKQTEPAGKENNKEPAVWSSNDFHPSRRPPGDRVDDNRKSRDVGYNESRSRDRLPDRGSRHDRDRNREVRNRDVSTRNRDNMSAETESSKNRDSRKNSRATDTIREKGRKKSQRSEPERSSDSDEKQDESGERRRKGGSDRNKDESNRRDRYSESRDKTREKSKREKRNESEDEPQQKSRREKRSESADEPRQKSRREKRSESPDEQRQKSRREKRSESADEQRQKSRREKRSESEDEPRQKSRREKRSESADEPRQKSRREKRSESADEPRQKSRREKHSEGRDQPREKSRRKERRSEDMKRRR